MKDVHGMMCSFVGRWNVSVEEANSLAIEFLTFHTTRTTAVNKCISSISCMYDD